MDILLSLSLSLSQNRHNYHPMPDSDSNISPCLATHCTSAFSFSLLSVSYHAFLLPFLQMHGLFGFWDFDWACLPGSSGRSPRGQDLTSLPQVALPNAQEEERSPRTSLFPNLPPSIPPLHKCLLLFFPPPYPFPKHVCPKFPSILAPVFRLCLPPVPTDLCVPLPLVVVTLDVPGGTEPPSSFWHFSLDGDEHAPSPTRALTPKLGTCLPPHPQLMFG